MNQPRTRGLGTGHTTGENDTASLPCPTDARENPRRRAALVYTNQARGLALQARLRHRRRISHALDQLLNPYPTVDPWVYAMPVEDVYAGHAMGLPERDAAGRDLAEARWTP